MGDVVGRGVRAAALMGKLRTSLEAYAFDGRSPEEVVERLHSLMERQHRTEMATLLYVVVEADRASADSRAPDICPCSSATQTERRVSSQETSHRRSGRFHSSGSRRLVDIEPGSALLLFTDGLVEVRGTSIELRLEELRRAVEAGPTAPDALCDALLERMLGHQEPQDDVALLVLACLPFPHTDSRSIYPRSRRRCHRSGSRSNAG